MIPKSLKVQLSLFFLMKIKCGVIIKEDLRRKIINTRDNYIFLSKFLQILLLVPK